MQALLGQKLSGEINLAAQILILIGLWIGFYFARKKQFARHRIVQTSMVSINSFFILFVMVASFYNNVIRGGATSGLVEGLMIIHGISGLLAEFTGIYLILLVNTTLIPPGLRVKNYKLVMRSLLGLWSLIVIGGIGIFTHFILPLFQLQAQSLPRSFCRHPTIFKCMQEKCSQRSSAAACPWLAAMPSI